MTYTPRLPPREHQRQVNPRLDARPDRPTSANVFAYLCEMGTGKTYMVINEWAEGVIAGLYDALLVVAPAGVYRNWHTIEIPKHLGEPVASKVMSAAWESGGSARNERTMSSLINHRGPRVLCINHEALVSAKGARQVAENFLSSSTAMIVVDESVLMKNPNAKITKVLSGDPAPRSGRPYPGLRKMAVARRICSGLVTPNSPEDLFSQFEFLDYKILGMPNFYAFKARYCITKSVCFMKNDEVYSLAMAANRGDVPAGLGREGLLAWCSEHKIHVPHVKITVAHRNLEELQAKIAPYSYRVRKDECLDLPPKIYLEPRGVTMPPEQARMYREMRDEAVTELANGVYASATAIIDILGRLQRLLCGNIKDEAGIVHEVPENRTAALLELLEDFEGKAVIWVPYRAPLERVARALREVYGEGSVLEFHGDTPLVDRPELDRLFQEDPEKRFMLGTQGAGGRGRTLTAASLVVYYANTFSLDHRLQSEDRVHRDGLQHEATYVDLHVPGTVDERLVAALRKKLDIASTIMNDGYRAWLT